MTLTEALQKVSDALNEPLNSTDPDKMGPYLFVKQIVKGLLDAEATGTNVCFLMHQAVLNQHQRTYEKAHRICEILGMNPMKRLTEDPRKANWVVRAVGYYYREQAL